MLENCVYNVAERLRVKKQQIPDQLQMCACFTKRLRDVCLLPPWTTVNMPMTHSKLKNTKVSVQDDDSENIANILFDKTVIPIVDYPRPLVDV